jgi:hypothetical protein
VSDIVRHTREGGNPASAFRAALETKRDPRFRGGDEIKDGGVFAKLGLRAKTADESMRVIMR